MHRSGEFFANLIEMLGWNGDRCIQLNRPEREIFDVSFHETLRRRGGRKMGLPRGSSCGIVPCSPTASYRLYLKRGAGLCI